MCDKLCSNLASSYLRDLSTWVKLNLKIMGKFAWWGTLRQESIQAGGEKAVVTVTKIRTRKEKISYCTGIIGKVSWGWNFILRQTNRGNDLVSRIPLSLHYIQPLSLAIMNLRVTCSIVHTNTTQNNSFSNLLARRGIHQSLAECFPFSE